MNHHHRNSFCRKAHRGEKSLQRICLLIQLLACVLRKARLQGQWTSLFGFAPAPFSIGYANKRNNFMTSRRERNILFLLSSPGPQKYFLSLCRFSLASRQKYSSRMRRRSKIANKFLALRKGNLNIFSDVPSLVRHFFPYKLHHLAHLDRRQTELASEKIQTNLSISIAFHLFIIIRIRDCYENATNEMNVLIGPLQSKTRLNCLPNARKITKNFHRPGKNSIERRKSFFYNLENPPWVSPIVESGTSLFEILLRLALEHGIKSKALQKKY